MKSIRPIPAPQKEIQESVNEFGQSIGLDSPQMLEFIENLVKGKSVILPTTDSCIYEDCLGLQEMLRKFTHSKFKAVSKLKYVRQLTSKCLHQQEFKDFISKDTQY